MTILKKLSTLFFLSILLTTVAKSAGLKKVLILDFINIEKNKNFQYLEVSITDAIRLELKKQFAFDEMKSSRWQNTAKTNFLFKQDYYTKSVALNIGLLAKQDIVISGGFRIVTPKGSTINNIFTQVRIIDVAQQKSITSFTLKGFADNRIFKSVDQIVAKITKEAKAILPNKEDWTKQSANDFGPKVPLVDDFVLGLRAGGAYMFNGWGKQFNANQPSFSLIMRMSLPIISRKIMFQAEANYATQSLDENANTVLNNLDLVVGATNVFATGYLLYEFELTNRFAILPKIGGGYNFQQLNANGQFTASSNNSFPVVAGGLDLAMNLSQSIDLVFSLQTLVELEKSIITYMNFANFGVNLKF